MMTIWSLTPSLKTPVPVPGPLLVILLLLPSSLGQWGYLENQAINEIRPGSPCEYNRDCAIISTGLKCLRGGCHCEYFRAEPYLDWTHPYFNPEVHKCVIRHGEVCVYNITAAQAQPTVLALMPGAGPGRRPALTSPASSWKDYHYTCEPETWCDPNQPLLEARHNGVCVRGGAAGIHVKGSSQYLYWLWLSAFLSSLSCLN